MSKNSTIYLPVRCTQTGAIPTREERERFLEEKIRECARDCIEGIVNEELEDALGIGRYERGEGRKGYRNRTRRRTFTTRNGKHEIDFPRGAYKDAGPDAKKEWNSKIIPRYARRFRRRVKTQGSLPNTDAGLKLLFGLLACGLISMRRIHGWKELPSAVAYKRAQMGLIKSIDKVA